MSVKHRYIIVCLILFFGLSFPVFADDQPPIKETRQGDWTIYTLSNGLVTLDVVPCVGGRILQYKLGDHGFFYVNPNEIGKMPQPTTLGKIGTWGNQGGAKLWPAPQGWDGPDQWPGPPDPILDGGVYTVIDKSDLAMTLQSPQDKEFSGIRFTNNFSIDPDGTQVQFEVSMKNVVDRPIRWGIWSHLQLDSGIKNSDEFNRLCVYCPINPESKFEKGYDVIFGEKDNPSFRVDSVNQMFEAEYQYQVGKVGIDSSAGWVATHDPRSGKVFVQQFAFEKDKEYPENSSVEVWHNGVGRIHAYHQELENHNDPETNPYVFESEILSPYALLRPSEEYRWKFTWNAANIGTEKPQIQCCTEAGIVVSKPEITIASNSQTSARIEFSGKFGVFFPGTLAVLPLNESGVEIGNPVTLAMVSPLKTASIDKKVLPIPDKCRSLRIVVIHPKTEKRFLLTEIPLNGT